jgi:hypothetical protein
MTPVTRKDAQVGRLHGCNKINDAPDLGASFIFNNHMIAAVI